MNFFGLVGRIASDPELKYTKSELAIARFAVAENMGKDKDAQFFNCTAFGKTAEFVEKYMPKGTSAFVTGNIKIDKYENKEGKKVTSYSVAVDKITFAGGKTESGEKHEAEKKAADDGFMKIPDDLGDEDLPFN